MSFHLSEFVVESQAVSLTTTDVRACSSSPSAGSGSEGGGGEKNDDRVEILTADHDGGRAAAAAGAGTRTDASVVCSRCRHAKPRSEFVRLGKLLRRCARCRGLSSQLKKQKRQQEVLKAAEASALVPDLPSYENYYLFTRDLRRDLIRFSPALVGSFPPFSSSPPTQLESESPTVAHETNAEYTLGPNLTLPNLLPPSSDAQITSTNTISTHLETAASELEEPKELFAALIDAVYESTGYLFIRRNTKRNTQKRTVKVYYICSRSKEKANLPHSEVSSKRTHRRELFDCNGNLSIRADFSTRKVLVQIRHSCIHISAERRPLKSKKQRETLLYPALSSSTSYDDTELGVEATYERCGAHPRWEQMKAVFAYLGASCNDDNRPLQDYVIEHLGGERYLDEFLSLAGER